MPAHCAVVNCSDKYVHSGSISFHRCETIRIFQTCFSYINLCFRFPFKRKDLLQKWMDFTQRSGQWMPSKWSAVCSRHFIDADFNCSNNRKTLKKNAVPTVRVPPAESLNVIVEQVTRLPAATVETAASNVNVSGTKSMCRFCGTSSPNCVSFDKSFELFAMIQKCFPTLQILQDDTLPLPKVICGECCRQLERFSQFCDVVMLAQSELQRKYRRQLKIKQEPVVRVKQEACESLDNLFPDELDMGLDDACCDHEPDANDETEHKFQFCEFPMLNAQDIINNCDIMEIINLDDPFINITDDADVAQAQPVGNAAPVMPSVNEMLQAELLTEEHNYAKEDWQLPVLQQYKTEKVEGVDNQATEQPQTQAQSQAQPPQQQPPHLLQPTPTDARSSKPIVTNVSQIPPPPLPPVSKPNIVVLNDSVVQSSAFRLHNCSMCSTKFFTAESLHQHFVQIHGTPTATATATPTPTPLSTPMVSLSLTGPSPLKLEGSSSMAVANYWQSDWLQPPQLPEKKKIDILDMQRSFLHRNDLITATLPEQLTPTPASAPQSQNVAYAKLAARYRRLQYKCRQLRHSGLKSELGQSSARRRYRCRHCRRSYASVQQLLSHRQRKRHFVLPPRSMFAMKCVGCLRLFRSRLALRQHMRYICQLLPLRNARLHSYRCRHCQLISFTHWRVYRRHELKCRKKAKGVGKRRRQATAAAAAVGTAALIAGRAHAKPQAKRNTHSCCVCQKTFTSRTGLKQHRITHSSERRYKCNICERVFKRRNGLSQHVKGFHLQLKPHQCPICQHRYALKCDMLRCRHSQRRSGAVHVNGETDAGTKAL